MPIRIVLIDDQTLGCGGIKGLLSLSDDVEVIAERWRRELGLQSNQHQVSPWLS